MSVYVVPQVLVYQELQLVPQASTRQQCAHVAGGHAYLQRYDNADEKPLGLLGYYDPNAEACYNWPGRPAGGVVDPTYTKVFIEDALLKYFDDALSAGQTISTVAGSRNRIRCATLAWEDNGADYPHSAALLDRGVKTGDIAHLTASVGGTPYDLWSYVAGFVADQVAATIAATVVDSGNTATRIQPDATNSQLAGPVNCVEISAVDQTAYNGLPDGDLDEIYTITVLQSSVDGDATTAVLRVTSASGNDDVATVLPLAFGSPTPIGTRGLLVTFDNNAGGGCSLSAEDDEVSPIDFAAGQVYQVTCGQQFLASSTHTSGGTYTGNVDTTYVVEVVSGGAIGSGNVRVAVTTTTGVDAVPATAIAAASPTVTIPVGTLGVTLTFSTAGSTQLNKGDKFYIAVEAVKDGYERTIVLGHNLPTEVFDNGATEVALELYIRKSFQVTENRYDSPPNVNYTASDTELCLQPGMTATDSTWTDAGETVALPVYSNSANDYGKLYVEYRAWLATLCNEVNSIYDVSELDDAISGPLHPDNPLKWGVFKAVSNSNGTPVRFTSVCDPDSVDSWLGVLELLDGRQDVWGLVPLTRNKTVQDAYVAHVLDQSSAEKGSWRTCWLNQAVDAAVAKVSAASSTDGEEVLATVSDDPDTSGTQYTLVAVPAHNGAFVTNGVAAGDVVRLAYVSDGFGGYTYDEYVVDAVINQDTLRLTAGPAAPISVAAKVEVWHNRTLTEKSAAAALCLGISSRRVMMTWPDEVGSGGYTFPGYHLSAALAGLASGVNPHQSLTNLEVNGFDDLSKTLQFNRTQLNAMAYGGCWIVTQDLSSGSVYTRHALTTAAYENINEREEDITRNLDNVSFYFRDLYAPYIGVSNVTDSTIEDIRATTDAGILELTSRNYVRRLGPQVRSGEVTECRAHAVLRDRIVVGLSLGLPYATNNIEQHIVV